MSSKGRKSNALSDHLDVDDDEDDHVTVVNRSSKHLGEREKIIVDAESFCLMQKKNLKSSDITAFLQSRNMAFYTSSCTISELTVHETDMAMALRFAMDAKDLGCGHGDSGKSSIECISNFVRDATYTVATKSEILRGTLQMIPDIRLISLDEVDFSLKNYSHQEFKPYSLERKRDIAPSTVVKSPGGMSHMSVDRSRKRNKHMKESHSAENENTEPLESKRLKCKHKWDINAEPSAGFRKKEKDVEESIEDLSAVQLIRAENNGPKLFIKHLGEFNFYKRIQYFEPFQVLVDTRFVERFFLQQPNAVETIQNLLGGRFVVLLTDCVSRKFKSNHPERLDLATELYHCPDPASYRRKDFDCLKDVIKQDGIKQQLILATGNKELKRLMAKYSLAPIIYFNDLEVKDKGAACELVFVAYDDERYAKFVECDETNNAEWLKKVLSTNCKSERVASVLVDEGFISYGMQHYNSMKVIVKRVSKLLGQQVVFSTTSCAFKKSNPSDHYISTFVNCGHTRPPLPSRDCIFSLVEKPESGICYVATACDVLKNTLSKVRFVNVLSINDGKIFLNNLVANEEQEGTSSSLGKAKKQDESEDSGSSGSGDSGGVGQIVGRQTKQYLLQIPTNKVGRVIGVGGFTIRNMQTCSGARMKVIQKQGDTSTVQIVGTSNEIEAAKQMVKLCLETALKKNKDKKGQEAEDYFNSHFNGTIIA